VLNADPTLGTPLKTGPNANGVKTNVDPVWATVLKVGAFEAVDPPKGDEAADLAKPEGGGFEGPAPKTGLPPNVGALKGEVNLIGFFSSAAEEEIAKQFPMDLREFWTFRFCIHIQYRHPVLLLSTYIYFDFAY
jgi:hypothetical protein